MSVEEETEDGPKEFKAFQGTMRLRESLEENYPSTYRGLDIRHNTPRSFDLLSAKDEKDELGNKAPVTLIRVAVDHANYRVLANKLKLKHAYNFTISISSENADSLAVVMVVYMGNDSTDVAVKKSSFTTEEPDTVAATGKARPPSGIWKWMRSATARP